MDPSLVELYEGGAPDDEVSVILRLAPGAEPPPAVIVVARFGPIITGRIARGAIPEARQHAGVVSMKAGSLVTATPLFEDIPGTEDEDAGLIDAIAAPPPVPGADGRGVLVGVCDWGLDFTHANFRNADGSTRLRWLWDQRGPRSALSPAPYGYGRLLTKAAIDAALAEPDPCAALGYHPASGDPAGSGSHGTHVTDILAGNRREPGSVVGLATQSDICFVHLAAPALAELDNLGDSVGLLEGLDCIRGAMVDTDAGCVLHLSAGKTGGPHRGDTLLEQAVDHMLQQPGIALVQSVGNYADAAMHTHARVGPAQEHVLRWITPARDRTPNELEIWYSGEDIFDVELLAPDGRRFTTPIDSRLSLEGDGGRWGNFYHRRREPNSGMNHVVVFLYPVAPTGTWQVTVRGRDVVDGRLQAWIERDAGNRDQSRFDRGQATSRYTTNTICNCFRAIAVGAYDATRPERPPTRFSSRGPTADGRQKPEITAPGYRVRAARSMPRGGWRGEARHVAKSGTSMAAPWVSGTVALMYAVAGRRLTIHEVRRALIGSADPHPGPPGASSSRLGYGYLNPAAAVDAARQIGRSAPAPPARETDEAGDIEEWWPADAEAHEGDAEAAGPGADALDPMVAEALEAAAIDPAQTWTDLHEAIEALDAAGT
jgi:subtilisin family serine protease